MNKFISFPCIIEGVSSRKDRSLKITLSTPELAPSEGSILLSLANQQAFAYISPNAIQEADLSVPGAVQEVGTKSPSKRLKDRMFVYFTQHLLKPKEEFNAWYETALERIGDSYLEKMQ
jgi:hypothetical protein